MRRRIPAQRKVSSAPGRPMPPAPERSVKLTVHHAYNCECPRCERERALYEKQVARERAVAAFGKGRC